MRRRHFLKTFGYGAVALGGARLLSACSSGGIPSGDPGLNVANPSFETLVGEGRRLNLVVRDLANEPVSEGTVDVYVRRIVEEGGEVLTGPAQATFFANDDNDTGVGSGVWQAEVDLAEPGLFEVVAVHDGQFGAEAVNVQRPEDAQAPAPGSEAVSTPTPTTDAPLDYREICTLQPACGMHTESLDDVLAAGRPAMVLFATPAYCVTVACGPATGNLEAVRTARDWGDLAFIHCEIYESEETANQRPAPPVLAWDLPTEPWTFAVDRDGTISDRIDGAMLREDMERLARALV